VAEAVVPKGVTTGAETVVGMKMQGLHEGGVCAKQQIGKEGGRNCVRAEFLVLSWGNLGISTPG
jgi:hypothetical protein